MIPSRARGLSATPDRHYQCIGDQLRGHRGIHRPPDNAAGEQVKHHRDIKPALGGPDVGEVRDPFLVGCLGRELAVQQVAGRRRGWPRPCVGRKASAPRPGAHGFLAHQPLDAVQAAPAAGGQNIVPHSPRTVGAVACQKTGPDVRQQCRVAARVIARGPSEPSMEAAARDTERLTSPGYRPYPSMFCDEAELHIDCFAK